MRGIDETSVPAWLTEHVDGAVAPFAFELIAGGRSNLTFLVTDATGRRFVLRRPPLGNVLATAHDMAREHRIISAVGQSSVPVPRTLGLCTDEEVNGVPFYVMSYVEGRVLTAADQLATLGDATRQRLVDDLVDVLAELHSVDLDEIGLGDLARRDGYIERQLKRWSTQWEASKTRDLPAVEELAARLATERPDQQRAAVAHGDYRLGNCLSDTDEGRIAAVLDWELCTLGDPLADLGYVGLWWPHEEGPDLSFRAAVDRYAARTGLDVSAIGYYVAFAGFRLAVIGEGVLARYRAGVMGDDAVDLSSMAADVARRVDDALAALDGI